tara:strand:+ start:406 stop:729 length:324 start_codon:yes stop_codon:yes gene_type:complete
VVLLISKLKYKFMPSKDPKIQKAYKDGVISKGQYDKLSDGLLLGIIKKKRGGGTKKGEVRKTARRAFEPKSKPTTKKGGTKEVRHKVGKEKNKPGRPKGGSKVVVDK